MADFDGAAYYTRDGARRARQRTMTRDGGRNVAEEESASDGIGGSLPPGMRRILGETTEAFEFPMLDKVLHECVRVWKRDKDGQPVRLAWVKASGSARSRLRTFPSTTWSDG